MINWTEGFCTTLRLRGYYFVSYELQADKRYHKSKMSCSCMKDNCDQTCQIFKDAVEIIPLEDEWQLKPER